jgi:hypothetical protein
VFIVIAALNAAAALLALFLQILRQRVMATKS